MPHRQKGDRDKPQSTLRKKGSMNSPLLRLKQSDQSTPIGKQSGKASTDVGNEEHLPGKKKEEERDLPKMKKARISRKKDQHQLPEKEAKRLAEMSTGGYL